MSREDSGAFRRGMTGCRDLRLVTNSGGVKLQNLIHWSKQAILRISWPLRVGGCGVKGRGTRRKDEESLRVIMRERVGSGGLHDKSGSADLVPTVMMTDWQFGPDKILQ